MGGSNPGDGVAAAFGELYAACGLPPPAVRMETGERDYRKSASILSGGGMNLGEMFLMPLAVVLAVFFLLSVAEFLSSLILFGVWMLTDSGGPNPLMVGAYEASASVVLFLAILAVARKAAMMSGWSVYLARQVGLDGIRSTSRVMASAISSALRSHAGVLPESRGDGALMSTNFIDACFRLGRRRVLDLGPDPRMTALVGALDPGNVSPRILRLAAAASALVDEALLMNGFVLALVPGCALPAPVLPLDEPVLQAARREDEGERRSWGFDHPFAESVRAVLKQEAGTAERELRALGVGECVNALSVRPFGQDPSGRLYRFRHDLLMVRVEDEVAGPDGSPLVHWVTVPPHVATAREAVAWSFGLPEADYAPTAQS